LIDDQNNLRRFNQIINGLIAYKGNNF